VEQPSKNALAANVYLFFVNTLANYIIKKLKKDHKISTVSFDNLLTDPIKTLSKIEEDLELDLSLPRELIEKDIAFKVGYLFDGNRLRLNKDVIVKKPAVSTPDIKGVSNLFYPLHKFTWYKY
jgi:hypothetical protein